MISLLGFFKRLQRKTVKSRKATRVQHKVIPKISIINMNNVMVLNTNSKSLAIKSIRLLQLILSQLGRTVGWRPSRCHHTKVRCTLDRSPVHRSSDVYRQTIIHAHVRVTNEANPSCMFLDCGGKSDHPDSAFTRTRLRAGSGSHTHFWTGQLRTS